jgi:UDP-2,4-diacetamido-2,4,6-trideoxy-beta-L-altropyranose hydrolase
VTAPVVFVADAGRDAGLGHVGRSSAVAAALRCRGIETVCLADGVLEPLELDGIRWLPLDDRALRESASAATVLVIDSYRLERESLAGAAPSSRLVVVHDHGRPPQGAALVVSVGKLPADGAPKLTGLAYAALRPDFWGLPERAPRDDVERVLVTTGSGALGAVGREVAQALAAALPAVRVAVVQGPYATVGAPSGVETIAAPRSLLVPLLEADLVVSAGGQTAAAGTPCVALPLVENQRAQTDVLAGLGAVRVVDPPEPSAAASAAVALARDPDARRALSEAGQRAVDGYGALRVAFEIALLAGRAP